MELFWTDYPNDKKNKMSSDARSVPGPKMWNFVRKWKLCFPVTIAWYVLLFSCVTAELSLSTESRESYSGGAHSYDDGASWQATGRQRSSLCPISITGRQQSRSRPRHTAEFTGQWLNGWWCFTAWQEPALHCHSSTELHLTQSNKLFYTCLCYCLIHYLSVELNILIVGAKICDQKCEGSV